MCLAPETLISSAPPMPWRRAMSTRERDHPVVLAPADEGIGAGVVETLVVPAFSGREQELPRHRQLARVAAKASKLRTVKIATGCHHLLTEFRVVEQQSWQLMRQFGDNAGHGSPIEPQPSQHSQAEAVNLSRHGWRSYRQWFIPLIKCSTKMDDRAQEHRVSRTIAPPTKSSAPWEIGVAREGWVGWFRSRRRSLRRRRLGAVAGIDEGLVAGAGHSINVSAQL